MFRNFFKKMGLILILAFTFGLGACGEKIDHYPSEPPLRNTDIPLVPLNSNDDNGSGAKSKEVEKTFEVNKNS
ncbi:MAG: hypothetical protein K1X44_02380 [Alphaproteobacteria bacterium]|nr:hypothetical protein [Alphaproteobacteria bacterium]